jgi:hypothetical protein
MDRVAQYRKYAVDCREMAVHTSNPEDRHALELQATAWERIANDRETTLRRDSEPNAQ